MGSQDIFYKVSCEPTSRWAIPQNLALKRGRVRVEKRERSGSGTLRMDLCPCLGFAGPARTRVQEGWLGYRGRTLPDDRLCGITPTPDVWSKAMLCDGRVVR